MAERRGASGLAGGGQRLNVPCKVRLKLFTLDHTLIVRRLGALSKRDGTAARDALRRFLAME